MLDYLLATTLVLAMFAPFVFSEVFADSIVVEFDKTPYYLGDSLTLSGEILDLGMPIIAVSVYDSDGKILSTNNLEISPEKTFSKTIPLDSPFYEKSGEYKVKLNYGQISQNHYFVVKGENSEAEEVAAVEEKNDDDVPSPKVILLFTDKELYTDGDIITISGLVSSLDSPSVLIGVYDSLGAPAGFYFGDIDSNLEFSTNFLVKAGVNFRVDGTYSIKAHYAETETISYFDFQKEPLPIIENEVDNDNESETTKNKQHEEELQQILDEILSEIEDDVKSKQQEQTNNEQTIDDNNNLSDNSSTNNFQYNNGSNSNDDSIIKNVEKENSTEQQKNSETKQSTNLSIEDIELGKLLNQINLECDSSTFTDTISYYDGMGPALYRLCKFDSSLNFFNESLIENPNYVEILVNKGSALGKLGYFSEAIIHYDQAIKIDPDFLPAKNNKANAFANLGMVGDAISLYSEILEENPDYLTARTNLAILLSSTQTSEIDNPIELPPKPSLEKIIIEDSLSLVPEESNLTNSENPRPPNFFEEVGSAFSSFGSLFNFLN